MYAGGSSCSATSSWDDDIVHKQLRYNYKPEEELGSRRRELDAAAAAGPTTTAASSSERSGRRLLRRSVSMSMVGVRGRLASAAREHKARLYIMRRCVSMLVRSSWGNAKDH